MDSVNRILNHYGVPMGGLTFQQIEKMKKTCLPKIAVTFDDFLKIGGNLSADETEAAQKIYQQVQSMIF